VRTQPPHVVKGYSMGLGVWIKRQPKYAIILLAVSLMALDEYLDLIGGPDLNISFFHLVPLGIVVWYAGFAPGAIYSLFCTAFIFWVDFHLDKGAFTRAYYYDAFANLVFFTVFALVLDRLNHRLTQVTEMAEKDGLTRLLNAGAFTQRANRDLQNPTGGTRSVTVAYIDVDDFKLINDRQGHAVGDDVLKTVGAVMNECFRDRDLCARVGGDEFAVFLPGLSREEAGPRLHDFQERLGRKMVAGGWKATFSIGAVTFTHPLAEIEPALRLADRAMYEVKSVGKNRLSLRESPEIETAGV